MKVRSLAVLFCAVMLTLSIGCGGGGGGAAGGGSTALATGTFIKQFGSVDSGGNYVPFWAANESKSQHLYTAAEIGGSGMITKLRYQRNNAYVADVTCPNLTLKMGHTTVSALTVTFADNVNTGKGAEQTVINNATVTLPAGALDTWFDITLATPFYYNGVDNLVVDFERTTACSANAATTTFTASNRRALSYAVDTTPGTAQYNVTTADVVDSFQNWVQFVFSGGDDMVNSGTALSYVAPFDTNATVRHVQILYSAASISGSGPITGIGMVVNGVTSGATYTATIKMGHSVLSALTTTYAANFSSAPVTVADTVRFTVPASIPSGGTVWLPVTGSFTYNGTDNLIVDLDVTGATGNTIWAYTSGFPNGSVYGPTGSATGGISVGGHQTKFRFNGGPVSIVTDGATSDTRFFPSGSAIGVVSLYRATELGTGGKITSVSCRSAINAATGNYPSFKLVIGHTAADTLTSTADFVSQTTGYAGAYTISNTILRGDWITVPLTTPFVYDGTSNLIVWFGTTAADGTGTNRCSFSTADGARYPSHTGLGAPGVSYTGSSSLKTDISLAITK